MTLGERIKARRKELHLSVEDVAEKLGKNRATVYRYESNDIKDMPITVLGPLAKVLQTTPADLTGWGKEEQEEKDGIRMIRVYGRVAAGRPIEATEEYLDTIPASPKMNPSDDYYGLSIAGDSMEPEIKLGDYVIVRKQDYAEDGDIVIVLVNGSDATCKQFRKHTNGISLVSLNPRYAPMFFTKEEIDEVPVRIIGKVIEIRRSL